MPPASRIRVARIRMHIDVAAINATVCMVADEYTEPRRGPSSVGYNIKYVYEVQKIINLTSCAAAVTIAVCVFALPWSWVSSAGLLAGLAQVYSSDGSQLQLATQAVTRTG